MIVWFLLRIDILVYEVKEGRKTDKVKVRDLRDSDNQDLTELGI